MPTHAFKQIVEGPVQRLRSVKGEGAIEFDPQLTDRLLGDIGTRNADALPLLAFVLERQLRRHDRLTLADYLETGGLSGAIVDAVAEAFRNPRNHPAIPEDAGQRLQLLRRAFIPALARIDEETGETRRRIARLSEIPKEAHPLIERLVEVRLLVRHQPLRDGQPDPQAPVEIEPAHEALLRQWPALKAWLEEERANLLNLEGLLRAAADWHDNRRAPDYLSHKGARLAEARALAKREDYRAKLEGVPRAYLDAAADAERAQASRRQRLQASVGALLVLVIAGLVAYINEQALSRVWFQWRYVDARSAAELATLKPGDSFLDCGDITGEPGTSRKGYSAQCPEMVVIKAGKFEMGAQDNERGSAPDELPRHWAKIEKRFAVSRFEITYEQWHHCVRLGGCKAEVGGGSGRKPVSGVSWKDAQGYVRWISSVTSQEYRLLTEEEWEYAARAETKTAYAFGNEITKRQAQFLSEGAATVGEFPANGFGLHDMHGNVSEWTEDCYGAYQTPSINFLKFFNEENSANCEYRVIRGGSWGDAEVTLRSAHRGSEGPSVYDVTIGFRVARTL